MNNFLEPPDNLHTDAESSLIPNIHDSLQNSVIIQSTPIKLAHKNTNESFIKPQLQQIDYFKVKNWCDAQDEYGVWRLGRIKSAKDTLRSIEFDGWGTKYQRQYCIHSEKLKPLRYHTIGYTGQKKVTLRDYELNIEELKSATIQLKYLMKQEGLKGFYPYELTRFLRCDLFYLIDTCLTIPYEVEQLDTIKVIKQFFFTFLEFSKKWLKILPSAFRNSQGSFHLDPESQYKSHDVALLNSGFEICLLLKGLFGFDDRCLKLYQNHIDEIYCQEFIQDFIIDNGIYSVADVLAYTDNTQQKGPGRRIQLEIIWPLLRSIMLIFRQMSPQGYMRQLKSFAKNTINYLEDLFEDQQYVDLFRQSEDHSKFLRELQKLFKTVIKDEKFPQFLNFDNQISRQQTTQRESLFFQPNNESKYRSISSLSMVCNDNVEHDDNPFYKQQKSRLQSRYYDDENRKYFNELYNQTQQDLHLQNKLNESQEIDNVREFFEEQLAKPNIVIHQKDQSQNQQNTKNIQNGQDKLDTHNYNSQFVYEPSQDQQQIKQLNDNQLGQKQPNQLRKCSEEILNTQNNHKIQVQNKQEQNNSIGECDQSDQMLLNQKKDIKQSTFRKDTYPKITIHIEDPNHSAANTTGDDTKQDYAISKQYNEEVVDITQIKKQQVNQIPSQSQSFLQRQNQFKFEKKDESISKPVFYAQQLEQKNQDIENQKIIQNAAQLIMVEQEPLQKQVFSPYEKIKEYQEVEEGQSLQHQLLSEFKNIKKEEQKNQINSAEAISANKWQSQLSDGIENKLEFMASEIQLLKNLVLQLSDQKIQSSQKSLENPNTLQINNNNLQLNEKNANQELQNKLLSSKKAENFQSNSGFKETQNTQQIALSNKISTPQQQVDFMKNQIVNPFNPSITNEQQEEIQTQKSLNQGLDVLGNQNKIQMRNEVKSEITQEYLKILESDQKKQLSEEIKSYLKQQQVDQYYFPYKSEKKQERHSFTSGVKQFESDNQQNNTNLSFQKMLDKICLEGNTNILNQSEIIIKEAWNNQLLLKEFELLCQIEFYLKESNILDSLKLIRWRKKLIQLQDLVGYEVTNLLLEKTKHKKEFSLQDLLFANVSYLKKNQSFLKNSVLKMD
ncbi:hypothetical protein TTHERM_01002780 (macronuclear) [Tetrahymena thermophila SB210]|uniref:Uncharacterized protein n=1 Tax=Tetrahymena thermophila (strain SB210) TaxID=312017 RepID=Q22D40_TETTS|nr:hypothetical protein TTHERM_01002780 [Tetrahymena thermophila SB210]EAR83213.2 hypothetical protein TTHERM_01002780 [Tetrahymena thermophila SB210]|eukprot:XP_001030876.2 hypothetical protein TTHERM_01002780 [Tetrahymena thermophila SB210]